MAKYVERKIARLTREITEIDHFFYHGFEDEDRASYASMLEHKRDDIVRATVLQIHTAIEDILSSLIFRRVLGIKAERHSRSMRSKRGRALHSMLHGPGSIGFRTKLNIAVEIKLLSSKTRTRLAVLNNLRNKCSHNWLLKQPIRRGRRPERREAAIAAV